MNFYVEEEALVQLARAKHYAKKSIDSGGLGKTNLKLSLGAAVRASKTTTSQYRPDFSRDEGNLAKSAERIIRLASFVQLNSTNRALQDPYVKKAMRLASVTLLDAAVHMIEELEAMLSERVENHKKRDQ